MLTHLSEILILDPHVLRLRSFQVKISCDLDNCYNANTERAMVVNNVEPN